MKKMTILDLVTYHYKLGRFFGLKQKQVWLELSSFTNTNANLKHWSIIINLA